MSKVIVLIFLVFALVSCSKNYTKDKELLDSFSKEFVEGKNYILIIPVEGCSGCRNKSLNFMKRNIGHKTIGFVLTTKRSIKDIRLMLMSKEIDLADKKFESLVLDTESKAYQTGIMDKFPVLYRLENKEIQEKHILSASYVDESLNDLGLR
ncbi:hypothetical protein [Bernardetia sp. MNP-M8]|uniref:hypothetical protein n=1 Tax=Bernardetia sp. MNP-M8 TaxID=3127470 RepID=UPI0030D107B1